MCHAIQHSTFEDLKMNLCTCREDATYRDVGFVLKMMRRHQCLGADRNAMGKIYVDVDLGM